MKNSYRLVPVDLIRQKKVDADLKTVQQIKLIAQLKKNLDDNGNATDSGNGQNVFVLTILIKSKKRD